MTDPRARMLVGDQGSTQLPQALHALDRLRVRVLVEPDLPPIAAGAAAGLIALLARMVAHLDLGSGSEQLRLSTNPWRVDRLGAVLPALSAVRPSPSRGADTDVTIGVGRLSQHVDIGLGGGAWTVRLGCTTQPIDVDEINDYGHALGLHAGAALAAGEVLKIALGPLGFANISVDADQALVWNLLDHRHGPATPPAPAAQTKPRVLLPGTGSVGTSIVALLAMSPGVRGELDAIDSDTFQPHRNPFRYPALRGDETGSKTAWAQALLRSAGWQAIGHHQSLGAWTSEQPHPGFDGLLVSSVDDLDARFDVADVLAKTTCSLGVSGLALHAQIEHLGDGLACPFCDYVDATPPRTQAHVIAEQVRLPVDRILALQVATASLSREDLLICHAAGAINAEAVEQLVGRRLADLLARTYADAVWSAPDAGADEQVAIAAPHVSWLTGVLGAAEIAKSAAGLPLLDRRVDVDLSGLPQDHTSHRPADASGRCACTSPHRQRWRRRLYGE